MASRKCNIPSRNTCNPEVQRRSSFCAQQHTRDIKEKPLHPGLATPLLNDHQKHLYPQYNQSRNRADANPDAILPFYRPLKN